jgi:hypothetical protein
MSLQTLAYLLLNATPVLVVSAAGFAVSLIYAKLWPRPARLMMLGCGILFTVAIVFPFVSHIIGNAAPDFLPDSRYSIMMALDLIKGLCNVVAIGLLLMAVFIERSPAPQDLEIVVPEAAAKFAREQSENGTPWNQINESLRQQGWDETTLAAVQVKLRQQSVTRRCAAGRKNMEFGAIWCAGGVGANILGLIADPQIGPKYVLTTCAIIYGGSHFVWGVKQVFNARYGTSEASPFTASAPTGYPD